VHGGQHGSCASNIPCGGPNAETATAGGGGSPAAQAESRGHHVLDESDWYTHIAITGHVEEWRDDPGLADIDRIARHYVGHPYQQRDRGRISAWIAIEAWHGWGALKDAR
jgi:hypothetical protein